MWVVGTRLDQALADRCCEMLEPGEETRRVAELLLQLGGTGATSRR